MEVGRAWYSLGTEDAQLRAGMAKAEALVTGSGTKAGAAGGAGIAKGLAAGAVAGGNAVTSAATATGGRISGIFSTVTGKIGGFFKTNIGGAIGALGAAFAATKIIGFFGDAIDAASDLGETTSKVSIVFGEAADEVFKMGETSARALGMSEQAALAAAGTYGNLFRAMGITEQESAKMSIGLVNLAADLASFNNMDPTEVLDKLRAGLSGETEPLRALGVNLNAARIQAKAFEMGLASTTAGLTPAIKAQATYALILEDTTLAQGDFARTSDGLANQQRILAAELENASAKIGEMLLPIMVDLAHFAVDVLIPALQGVIDYFKNMAENIGEQADAVADHLRSLDLSFGELGKTVEERANQIGVDAGEMKRHFATAINDMGLDIAAAMEYAERATLGLPPLVSEAARQSLANWKQEDMGGGIAADIAAGDDILRRGIQSGIAEPTAEELAQVKEDAQAAARAMTADYAATIASGADDVTQAWDALLKGAESEMSEAARIADIQAKLASPALRNALRSEDPYLRAQAISTKQTLLDQLALLESGAIDLAVRTGQALPDALNSAQAATALAAQRQALAATRQFDLAQIPASTAGSRTGSAFGTGLGSQYGYVTSKAAGVASGARYPLAALSGQSYGWGQTLGYNFARGIGSTYSVAYSQAAAVAGGAAAALRIRSPAKAGPLSEDARIWGRRLGHNFAGGIGDAIGSVRRAAMAMGGAAIPSLRPLTFSAQGADVARSMVGGGGNSATFGNIQIGIHLPTGWQGNDGDVDNLSRRLATQIRMRASSAFR